jgi:hypothetical protein
MNGNQVNVVDINRLKDILQTAVRNVLENQNERYMNFLDIHNRTEAWWQWEYAAELIKIAISENVPICIDVNKKPRECGIKSHKKQLIDLFIGQWPDSKDKCDYSLTPRIWIEIKQRGTYEINNILNGLYEDIEKLNCIPWSKQDYAIASLILVHDSNNQIDPNECQQEINRIGYPLLFNDPIQISGYREEKEIHRLVSLYFYQIHPNEEY